jgi:hypothetical protein
MFEIFRSFTENGDKGSGEFLKLLNEQAQNISLPPQQNLYLILQNIIKCFKLKRNSSHPERMIGRNFISGEDEKQLVSFVSVHEKNDANYRHLIHWLWSHRSLVFSFASNDRAINYFQLSLCLDFIKEFKKAKSMNLFDFPLVHLLDQLMVSPHLHELVQYPPNCLRLVDILHSLIQFLSRTVSSELFTRYLQLLTQFHSLIIQIYTSRRIFPSSASQSYTTDQCPLIHSSSLVSSLGLSLFTLHLETLCFILRQHQLPAPPTDGSQTEEEFHPYLLVAHSDVLSYLRELLSHASDHYLKEPNLRLDPIAFSWLMIASLSDNDKTLLSTLNLLEELHLSLEILQHTPPDLHHSATHHHLFQHTSRTLTSPLLFSREALIIFFCQCLCFDPLILLDLISQNETTGLQYFLRIIKYLERSHSPPHSDSLLMRCCERLTKKTISVKGSVSGVSHDGGGGDWHDLIRSYCSSDSDLSSASSESSVRGQSGVSPRHAIIWMKSESLLLSEENGGTEAGVRPKKRKATVIDSTEAEEEEEEERNFSNNQSSNVPSHLHLSDWRCHHSDEERECEILPQVSPELWRVFQEQHHSAEELFENIRIFFLETETKLDEMNTHHLLPFDASPLVRRLTHLNEILDQNE